MIQRYIDRRRSTQGSIALSFAVHGGLLLLLFIMVSRQVAMVNEGGELTEIAYIEARYGEDVAAKVKMKAKPRRDPSPPGMGVTTDSAVKKSADPEPPRPEPRPALTAKPQLPEIAAPQTRVEVNEVQVPKVQPTTVQPQMLAEADQMQAAQPRATNRQIIDASRLKGALAPSAADVKGLQAARPVNRELFKAQAGTALKNRHGEIATGDGGVPAVSSQGRAGVVAEAPAAIGAGGALQNRSRNGGYQAPTAGLAGADKSQSGTSGGKGVLDVEGPSGGGGQSSGRKTILNYGSGNGGRGGGLAGRRTRLVEPTTTKSIVADQSADVGDAKQAVTEAKLGQGDGVNMSISGQIKGRKILHAAAAVYSQKARKKGWEGAVAVHFTVLADGRVKDNLYFEQTSVHRDLNQAAMQAIREFRFAPLPSGQAAVEQWGVITIVFRLN